MSGQRSTSPLAIARRWLHGQMKDNLAHGQAYLLREARGQGIAPLTLFRAARYLDMKSTWAWSSANRSLITIWYLTDVPAFPPDLKAFKRLTPRGRRRGHKKYPSSLGERQKEYSLGDE